MNRLGLEDIASPCSSYVEVSQQFQAAARRIRETQTADQLRAYLLETPRTDTPLEQSEIAEPR